MKFIKTISIGISVKLFLAFWVVIISSSIISHVITIHFMKTVSQEIANPQQLTLLNQFSLKLRSNRKENFHHLQRKFIQKYNQHLFIKDLATHKVHIPEKGVWRRVEHYLQKNALPNPTTINFSYTQVTGPKNVVIKGRDYQLFVATLMDREKIHNIVNKLPLLLKIIIMLILSALLCWLIAKALSKPLIAIRKASDELGKGNLTTRLSGFESRSDEFGAVAKSFNQMANQLESNISAHQRLLGDVSHELRSPLARLQLAIGLSEKNIGNPVEQQRHLTRCENEVERLDEMIADVLLLSRLEHSNSATHHQYLRLEKLTQQTIDDCQYTANAKEVKITLAAPQKCLFYGDEKSLNSAISNILNNAIKYSPNKAIITVTLTVTNEKITLTVVDQGVGVPEEMLTKLFMPFFRVANGRERCSGGTGLGLAISRQAIKQHQGSISAKNIQPHGLLVSIVLPMKPA